MNFPSFCISLKAAVQIAIAKGRYTLTATEYSDADDSNELTLTASEGVGNALEYLVKGGHTLDDLRRVVSQIDEPSQGDSFAIALQQMSKRGWLCYAVPSLAIAIPMVELADLQLNQADQLPEPLQLCRFTYQRQHEGAMVLESPLSKFRIVLSDWRASALLSLLAQPQSLSALNHFPNLSVANIQQFVHLLWATQFLVAGAEERSLQLWEFHSLMFHSRSRVGRHDYKLGETEQFSDSFSPLAVVKPPMSSQAIPLPHPDIEALIQHDQTLTEAIESRRSIRRHDDTCPISLEQLSELLYRSARVKETYQLDDLIHKSDNMTVNFGELSDRPYPGGGAMYELEIYPVVRCCTGLETGLYHYAPLTHQLEYLAAAHNDIEALLADARLASNTDSMPQVLLVITARFGRLFWKYRSIAYALVLKHVGVLYQTLYLVATSMQLAPCALGVGDSDRFAQAANISYTEESAVGEFIVGSPTNCRRAP